VIQQDLAEIGVKVKATALEEGVWVERAWVANPAKMDATVAYYAAYAGASMALVNWSPDLAGGFGIGFEPDDPKITAVINESWQATGADEEEAVVKAAQAIEEQAATIPLVTRPAIFAFRSDRIKADFVAADGNIDPLHNVADFTRVKSS
jgi:peptide/nickel transport system substrate-binding protein